MPSPPEFLPARPWPGSSQHVTTKEPQVRGAACGPPSVLPCNAVSSHCVTEGLQETKQTKIASSSLVPRELAGCGGGWEPQGLASSELTVDSRLGRLGGGASLGSPPPILQLPVPAWTRTGHPRRAKLLTPTPVHRLSVWLISPIPPCPSSFKIHPKCHTLQEILPGPHPGQTTHGTLNFCIYCVCHTVLPALSPHETVS